MTRSVSNRHPRISFIGMRALLLVIACGVVEVCRAQFPGQKTYCNPIDLNYQYNFEQKAQGISYRSGADPVIVNHKNEYYLFATISGGWWHSKDLVNCGLNELNQLNGLPELHEASRVHPG